MAKSTAWANPEMTAHLNKQGLSIRPPRWTEQANLPATNARWFCGRAGWGERPAALAKDCFGGDGARLFLVGTLAPRPDLASFPFNNCSKYCCGPVPIRVRRGRRDRWESGPGATLQRHLGFWTVGGCLMFENFPLNCARMNLRAARMPPSSITGAEAKTHRHGEIGETLAAPAAAFQLCQASELPNSDGLARCGRECDVGQMGRGSA